MASRKEIIAPSPSTLDPGKSAKLSINAGLTNSSCCHTRPKTRMVRVSVNLGSGALCSLSKKRVGLSASVISKSCNVKYSAFNLRSASTSSISRGA